ncbi:MAG: phytoene desaturase family protein [Acidimicrobiales bacterium]
MRAVVVGGGPNGLAGAAVLARAGLEVTVLEAADVVGGGTRSGEAIVDGLLHDHCSAVHPLAVGSPLFDELDLGAHGLVWRYPEIDCAHPLDDGSAGVLHRSVAETVAGLGDDGAAWRRLFEDGAHGFDELRHDVLGPLVRVPKHPISLARFGIPALAPATVLARTFQRPQTRALWAGVAAHAYTRLDRPLSSSIGLGILTAGHRYGWAVAEGGSQRIADALVSVGRAAGVSIETGVRVTSAAQVADADVVLWDLAPAAVAEILEDRLPSRASRALRRFRRGPGAWKLDLAVEGGVPWRNEAARRAGTVHVGGTIEEIAAAEADVVAGRMPERPFVLVGQQYLADPGRSVGHVHPVWAYAHVPHGYDRDCEATILDQIERFAPGFRDRVVGTQATRPGDFAAWNPNFVGGDILTGAKDVRQLVFGPRIGRHPYDTGLDGHYLCSAATPPGPGAHGMCGAHAARRALAAEGLAQPLS